MMRNVLPRILLLLFPVFSLVLAPEIARADTDRTILPMPDPPFEGEVALRPEDSEKDFPEEPTAPEGAPNVLLILTDDIGFGATSTFGGPIPTPTADRIANMGVRYNTFHTTALCSPTRAALLTGRNHHSAATGAITELGVGYPGYNTLVPQAKRGLGDILKLNGYNTSWFGKNHNVPDWHTSQAGPFTLWPVGLGFEYFYGFVGGDTNQWAPALIENTMPLEPPDEEGYHFDRDMADQAIRWLKMQKSVAPEKPFFLYYATGTAHAPHHAPDEYIAKFKGDFDQGWDKQREETFDNQIDMGIIPVGTTLTDRPADIEPWDAQSAQEKEVFAHMMEVYAAAVNHSDFHIGRVIDAIEALGELDNTLIIFIQGDNGASAEGSPQGLLNEMTFMNGIAEDFDEVYARRNELGSPTTYNHYPIGWAHAMNTPFQWTKQVASHFGGTRNGMIMAWPGRIPAGGQIRNQFHHVIDIMPTILEATQLPAPEEVYGIQQAPIEGVSMTYSWTDATAESHRDTQYFEMLANRAIYHNGWVAATTPQTLPWSESESLVDPITGYPWELYNLADDFAQADNVADVPENKEWLEELQLLFYVEAAAFHALPLDGTTVSRLRVDNRPSNIRGMSDFTYYEGMVRIPEGSAPDLKNKSFSITAEVDIPDGGAEGVLMTQGGRFAGLGLYILDSRPVFFYNNSGVHTYRVAGSNQLTKGKHTIKLDFTYDYPTGTLGSGGLAILTVDNAEVARGTLQHTIPNRISLDETLDIGEDTGTSVNPADYDELPFKFTGGLESVLIHVDGAPATAPGSLTAMADYEGDRNAGVINLSWTATNNNVSTYEIERSKSGSDFSIIDTVNGNTTSYTDDSNLAGETTYTYRIRACNSVGCSDNSDTASATTFEDPI